MRNLSIVEYEYFCNDVGAFDEQAVSFTVDSLTSTLYVITSSGFIYLKQKKNNEFHKIIELEGEDWINITYVADIEALCCASSGGQLLSINVDYEQNNETPICTVNKMGSIEEVGGIAAMAWSPGEEVLAILTRANVFLIISPDADVLVKKNPSIMKQIYIMAYVIFDVCIPNHHHDIYLYVCVTIFDLSFIIM